MVVWIVWQRSPRLDYYIGDGKLHPGTQYVYVAASSMSSTFASSDHVTGINKISRWVKKGILSMAIRGSPVSRIQDPGSELIM